MAALRLITEMLTKLGVEDVLAFQNKNLCTPLHLAAEAEHAEAVALLLEAGASANVPDKDGDTPVHIAVRNNSPGILKRLLVSNVSITHQ